MKKLRLKNFDIHPICQRNHGKSVFVPVGAELDPDAGKQPIWKFKSSDLVQARVN